MTEAYLDEVDVVVDLNSEDESGLPGRSSTRPGTQASWSKEPGSSSVRAPLGPWPKSSRSTATLSGSALCPGLSSVIATYCTKGTA